MTEKLYWEDAYKAEFSAIVTKVEGKFIQLDRTAFYPTGGGQPNDIGAITINGTTYSIVDVTKENDEIIHTSDTLVNARLGDCATGKIDWERRYSIMRYHTALHLFNAIVEKRYATAVTRGNQIYQDRARIDLDLNELNREKAQELIKDANLIAKEAHTVRSRNVTRETALSIPAIAKTEPGRALINSLDIIRLVEIEGVDIQMDGGTHVKNTSELGTFNLKAFENKGTGRKRVELTLSSP